jgi:putative membrane protein
MSDPSDAKPDAELPPPHPVQARVDQLGIRDKLAYDRTHLANERTFAAWLRTGLTIAAGGIAVAHIVPEPARDSTVSLLLGIAFVLVGVGCITYGAVQYARVSARLARTAPRRVSMSTPGIYVVTIVLAALLLAVLWFLWSHRGHTRSSAARDWSTPRVEAIAAWHLRHRPDLPQGIRLGDWT